jgi:hypothetical protein
MKLVFTPAPLQLAQVQVRNTALLALAFTADTRYNDMDFEPK